MNIPEKVLKQRMTKIVSTCLLRTGGGRGNLQKNYWENLIAECIFSNIEHPLPPIP
jgi:hypothetical protein